MVYKYRSECGGALGALSAFSHQHTRLFVQSVQLTPTSFRFARRDEDGIHNLEQNTYIATAGNACLSLAATDWKILKWNHL